MTAVPPFPEGQVEALARAIGECGSGSDITRVMRDRGIVDDSSESTKWRRLYWTFLKVHAEQKCANGILDFIQAVLVPARFTGRSEEFESHREKLNAILSFAGIEYRADGTFRAREAARTLDEAEMRLRTIQSKFKSRRLHPEVLKYCNTELLQYNYFHAVVEATKGLAQRIRDCSGVDADGAALIDRVFLVEHPILAFNSLRTETEKSAH